MSLTSELVQHHGQLPTWYDSTQWQRAWAETTLESIPRSRRMNVRLDGRHFTVAHYLVTDSPFWSGYETKAGVGPVFEGPCLMLPSLYTVYGPSHIAAHERTVAEVVDGALHDAQRWSADALLVTNLTKQAADQWSRTRPPCASIRLDVAYSADISGGIDEMHTLARRNRIELRRRWRRAVERGLVLVNLPGPQALHRLPEVAWLCNASAVKHGIAPLYDLTTFQRLAELPQARVLIAEHEGRALAAFFAFADQDALHLWAGGIDYTRLAEFSPYLFLLYELISIAPTQGWQRLEFGRGSYEFKRKYGFTGVELWTLCYPVAPEAGPRLAERLSDMHQRLTRFMGISLSEVTQ